MPSIGFLKKTLMRFAFSLAGALVLAALASSADFQMTFTAAERVLPAVKSIAVAKAGEPGPGMAKFEAIAESAKYKEAIRLPVEGPYDVWWQSKEGIAVKVVGGLTLKAGKSVVLD
jgi:hypothetical protein